MGNIQEFAFIGVKNMLVKKDGKVRMEFPYLVGFNLSDSQPLEYLRGGYGNQKLLPFKGDRETSVTVTTATANPEFMELMYNTEFTEEETLVDKVVNLTGVNGEFAIPTDEPVTAGTSMTVWAVDNHGRKTELLKTDADVETGKYVFDGAVIKTESTITSLRVAYITTHKAQVWKAKDINTETYEVTGIIVGQEVGTGTLFDVQFYAPVAVFQLNNVLNASNEGGVPENVQFTIDMLADVTKDYTYILSFIDK